MNGLKAMPDSAPFNRNVLNQNVFDFWFRRCRNAGGAVLRELRGRIQAIRNGFRGPGHPWTLMDVTLIDVTRADVTRMDVQTLMG